MTTKFNHYLPNVWYCVADRLDYACHKICLQ